MAEKEIKSCSDCIHYDACYKIEHYGQSPETTALLCELYIDKNDVAPVKHGHWILLRESEITGFNPEFAGRDPIGGYQCSNCKEEAIFDCNDEFVLSSYCPNCGTKMDGGEQE